MHLAIKKSGLSVSLSVKFCRHMQYIFSYKWYDHDLWTRRFIWGSGLNWSNSKHVNRCSRIFPWSYELWDGSISKHMSVANVMAKMPQSTALPSCWTGKQLIFKDAPEHAAILQMDWIVVCLWGTRCSPHEKAN